MRKVAVVARTRKPVPDTLKSEAVRIRAKRELAELEQARFVAKALAEGASQESVAEVLGVSQATVSRLSSRVKTKPASLRPTVAEVVNRAAAKEISHARMLRELQNLRVAYVKPERFPDSDWALLRRAVQEGLLTRADARKVAEDTARRFVARVTGSMELEDQAIQEPAVAQMLRETTDRMVSSLV
ncbi:hypothetical protein FHP29_14125 [Nocardioides albidus]|uniref:Uncharacterized protein n=1 Tax=Nocardioides albidus TaxID=1517589 RepID=A0A5C4VRA1_9ACTN|nr:helix-turn-helix domain-containing protein [Nocardioides albidus]TNM38397.1 hypothetical protein FHP29_14125 [Nocardioides albidus]